MTNNFVGKEYRIVARHSGKGLAINGGGNEDGANCVQWRYVDKDNHKFLIFPLDNDYVIIAKHSGKGLAITGGGSQDGANCVQWSYADKANHQFLLEPLNGSNTYKIICKHSDKGLAIAGEGSQDGANCVQWSYADKANHQFRLETVRTYFDPATLRQSVAKPGRIPDFPRLESYTTWLPEETDAVVIGETLIPFFLVEDVHLTPDRQAKVTPYYILTREQYWVKQFEIEHSGAYARRHTYRSLVGMSETESKTITETLGVSVTAEAGFSFAGASASLSTTVSRELQVSSTSNRTRIQEHEETETREYPAGKKFTLAGWVLTDRYTLNRLNGTQVSKWTVGNPKFVREDSYPEYE
jgi:hypothetical protein